MEIPVISRDRVMLFTVPIPVGRTADDFIPIVKETILFAITRFLNGDREKRNFDEQITPFAADDFIVIFGESSPVPQLTGEKRKQVEQLTQHTIAVICTRDSTDIESFRQILNLYLRGSRNNYFSIEKSFKRGLNHEVADKETGEKFDLGHPLYGQKFYLNLEHPLYSPSFSNKSNPQINEAYKDIFIFMLFNIPTVSSVAGFDEIFRLGEIPEKNSEWKLILQTFDMRRPIEVTPRAVTVAMSALLQAEDRTTWPKPGESVISKPSEPPAQLPELPAEIAAEIEDAQLTAEESSVDAVNDADLIDAIQRAEDAERSVSEINDELDYANSENVQLAAEIDSLKTELEASRDELNSANEFISQMSAELNLKNAQIAQLLATLASANAHIANLSALL